MGLVLADPAVAAQKPAVGAACAKLHATNKASGKDVTCMKRQGKLVWVLHPAPKPTSTPKPSATPLKDFEKLYQDIGERAKGMRSTAPAGYFDFRAAPSIPADKAADMRRAVELAFAPWIDVLTPNGFKVVLVDENSKAFYDANAPKPGFCPGYGERLFGFGSMVTGGYGCWSRTGDAALMLYLGSGVRAESFGPVYLAHEVSHIAQMATTHPKFGDEYACWFDEGQAELHGKIYGDVVGNGSNVHLDFVNDARTIGRNNGLTDAASWAAFMKAHENRDSSCGTNNYNYKVGALMNENLYVTFGRDKIAAFMRGTGSAAWRTAFTNAFGVTPDAWYSESAAPYVVEQIKALPY